jgi:hypothetical protein
MGRRRGMELFAGGIVPHASEARFTGLYLVMPEYT